MWDESFHMALMSLSKVQVPEMWQFSQLDDSKRSYFKVVNGRKIQFKVLLTVKKSYKTHKVLKFYSLNLLSIALNTDLVTIFYWPIDPLWLGVKQIVRLEEILVFLRTQFFIIKKSLVIFSIVESIHLSIKLIVNAVIKSYYQRVILLSTKTSSSILNVLVL